MTKNRAMSDFNERRRAQIRETNAQRNATTGGQGGGDGPIDPGVERRLTSLETSVHDTAVAITRIEFKLEGRLDTLTERLHAHGESFARVEALLKGLDAKVDGKLIGGVQFFGIFAGLMTIFFALGGGALAALKYLGMLH